MSLFWSLIDLSLSALQVFLIDNAPSMSCYTQEIRNVVQLLFYILNTCDPDGLDLYFTTSPDKHRPKKIPALLKTLDDNLPKNPNGITPIMQHRFSNMIEEYQNKLGQKHFFRTIFRRSQPKKGPR